MRFYSPSTGGFYDEAINGEDIPTDKIEISDEEHMALMQGQVAGQRIVPSEDGGKPILAAQRPRTADEQKAFLTGIVQRHLDAQAQSMGYDDLRTAATYADEPRVARFQAEGRALRAWRSDVWESCIAVLNEVTAGSRPVPTPDQLIAELPTFSLPPT